MAVLKLIINGDNCWPELFAPAKNGRVLHLPPAGPPIGIAVLRGAMASGKPSIMLRIDIPGGPVVLAETSARLFCSAAKLILEHYPGLLDD